MLHILDESVGLKLLSYFRIAFIHFSFISDDLGKL